MFGAILGDIIGSPYEFDRGDKTKDFPLFSGKSEFTDDTVMTIAVADALMKVGKDATDREIEEALVKSLKYWGLKYPVAGYGMRFFTWLKLKNTEPYNSFGNGSAMRVSAAAWIGDTMEEVRRLARLSAQVTHNHPEGIKGAEATAAIIFMARIGCRDKAQIKAFVEKEFGYDLSRTCDEIRPDYYHVESCQETVPEAITAFLEGEDFEDVIRTAVSLGGDCDTLTCIAGSMAEAFCGIPVWLKNQCYERLDDDLRRVLGEFERMYQFEENSPSKPVFWFEDAEGEGVKMLTGYGDCKVMREKREGFGTSKQALKGWQRAMLCVDAFGIWDATAFACTMGATLCYGPMAEDDEPYVLTFTSCQAADRSVYPYMPKEEVRKARRLVDKFYKSQRAQFDWQHMILHPVCIKVHKSGKAEAMDLTELAPLGFDDDYCGACSFSELMKGNEWPFRRF